jgi:hypothetical protein
MTFADDQRYGNHQAVLWMEGVTCGTSFRHLSKHLPCQNLGSPGGPWIEADPPEVLTVFLIPEWGVERLTPIRVDMRTQYIPTSYFSASLAARAGSRSALKDRGPSIGGEPNAQPRLGPASVLITLVANRESDRVLPRRHRAICPVVAKWLLS